ncbi:MAG TPA: endo-1,4-beta-xylanase [Bacteroidota bacterium]|nr:endo-1,4-beta-xylanase [Bacteroidota bacterium]
MADGELLFRPYFVQQGRGPHLLDWAYASDTHGDAFHSNITASASGVRVSDTEGHPHFAINVRWNVEGFGYTYMTADNAGAFYELPASGSRALNLNYELAQSRVARNALRLRTHSRDGWKPSRELAGFLEISEGYLADAQASSADEPRCGWLAQNALLYALRAGEALELERARFDIRGRGGRRDFFLGCDARGYFQMNVELFLERFSPLFDYATITHYLISGVFEDFEPEEGRLAFPLRDALFTQLQQRKFTIEGRPLWWSYKTTTPDWLRHKSYDQIRTYLEKHIRAVMRHYGDGMYAWEIVNEFHDWANECQLTPDQAVELTRLACDVARDANAKVKRLINNCSPFAEYVQLRKWTDLDAKYPQRTPYQFLKALVEAGVDFDISGIQMYYPYRDLADIALFLERIESLGKRVHLTEVGASSGATEESVKSGKLPIAFDPYPWHRPWDEDLQADWMEGVYTLAHARPSVEAVNWYDFVDPYSWIANGGFLRSPKGETKPIVDRLLSLRREWHIERKVS